MNKKKIMAIPADVWACGKYRITDPFSRLAAIESPFQFDVFDPTKEQNNLPAQVFAQRLMEYDAIVFQRVCDPALASVLVALKNAGKKVYMDLDDDLFNVSTFSPAFSVWRPTSPAVKILKEVLSNIDCLLLSTPELVNTYKHLVKDTVVFGNGIDVHDPKFSQSNSLRKNLPDDKTIVMWTGSSTHYDSLQEIAGKLSVTFQKRPDAQFALCGNKEFLDMFSLPNEQKTFIPHVQIDEFYNIPSHADIGLAPVKINKFNEGKSELKCIEYGMWGIPVVCTDIAPYRRFNELSGGGNLLCKSNKPKEWNKNIAKLIDDPELRKELGEKSRKTVIEYYDVNKINLERLKFFEKELLSN